MFFITVRIYFEMEACLSEMKVVMVMPHPVRYSIHDLKDINSIAGLLPAWFLCIYYNEKKIVMSECSIDKFMLVYFSSYIMVNYK